MNINAIQGNCLDLHMYEDNTFDITLVLGLMYHLYNELDEEEFNIYLDYHLKNCDRKVLMGYSSHILEIVEKKEK